MANTEQLEILKQGVEVWNKWRKENPDNEVDLKEADLEGVSLWKVDLRGADLWRADLMEAGLSKADLSGTNLWQANLSGADLSSANLKGANLWGAQASLADLHGADLREAKLILADLSLADLSLADLSLADLSGTNLWQANLQETNFSRTRVGNTIFGDLNLRQVIGLDEIQHGSPSTVGTNTLANSEGKIPEVFLRGCGLSDWEIEEVKLYNPDLSNEEINKILYKIYELRATQALQISPLFVSYSQGDGEFVDKLESQLNAKGIRYWREIMEYNILDFSAWQNDSKFENMFRKLIDGLELFYKG